MAIINKKLNQKKGPKLSRSDKWKRNPVPWIVLLLLSAGIIWKFVFNNFTDFLIKRDQIVQFSEENIKLEEKNESLKINLDEIKVDFTKEASETLAKEEQIFPEDIDIKKAIKVLEVFSLILDYDIDGSNYFSLDSVTFNTPSSEEKENYSKLRANVRVVGTKQNVNNFVDFLKTGEIPPKVEQKIKNASDMAIDIQFLGQNLLPLAVLDSIRITKHKSSEMDLVDLLAVELQIIFYSQN